MATLAVEGMHFYAFHGYYESERKVGGQYTVDVFVTLPDNIGQSDQLSNTLNYESIYSIAREVMSVSSHLIEHVCQEILASLRSKFPEIEKFKVKVKKHHPPLPGEVDATFIEMEG